jgi:anti-anti-sigma regulatory factor
MSEGARSPASLTILVACVEERIVLRPTGQLTASTASLLEDALSALLEIDPNIVLEVGALEMADDVGSLDWAFRRAREAGGTLHVRREAPPEVLSSVRSRRDVA